MKKGGATPSTIVRQFNGERTKLCRAELDIDVQSFLFMSVIILTININFTICPCQLICYVTF